MGSQYERYHGVLLPAGPAGRQAQHCPTVADQLWKLYAVPRERIVRIRGAAATDRFTPAPDRGAIRGELGLSADRAILLTVRNLEARMGLDNLLGAMAVLKVLKALNAPPAVFVPRCRRESRPC